MRDVTDNRFDDCLRATLARVPAPTMGQQAAAWERLRARAVHQPVLPPDPAPCAEPGAWQRALWAWLHWFIFDEDTFARALRQRPLMMRPVCGVPTGTDFAIIV